MTLAKKIFKYSICILIILLILLIGALGGSYLLRNNDLYQNFILGMAFDDEVTSEGELTISLEGSHLTLAFDNWTVKNLEEETQPEILSIASGTLAYNPFSVFGMGQQIPSIDLSNVKFDRQEGLRPLSIPSVTKKDQKIDLSGSIGDVSIKANIDLAAETLNAQLRDLTLNSDFEGRFTDLEDIVLTKGERRLEGDYEKKGSKHLIDLEFADDNELKIDYRPKSNKQLLRIKSDQFNIQDISTIQYFVGEISSLIQDMTVSDSDDEGQEANRPLKAYINIEKLAALDKSAGHIKATVLSDGDGLHIAPKDIVIAEGRVTGDVYISKVAEKQTKIDVVWDDYNFGLFRVMLGQESKSIGKGMMRLDLTAEGGDTETLKKTLNGGIEAELKNGRIGAGFINLWGGGVLNSLIPSFQSEESDQADLNCARIYVKLENGVGRVKPVVLDTSKVTLYGKGELSIPDDTVNIVIKPKSKGIALGDISSAVRVGGELSNPSFSLDTMSALKKIGTIALGTVNPAFYIFSLSDLGLNQEDVCASDPE